MRKPFTTNIDKTIQNEFKKKCQSNRIKMNDILEALMKLYADGEIGIKIQTNYDIDYLNYNSKDMNYWGKYKNQLVGIELDRPSGLYIYKYKLHENQVKNYNEIKMGGGLKVLINTYEQMAAINQPSNMEIIDSTEINLNERILSIKGILEVADNIMRYLSIATSRTIPETISNEVIYKFSTANVARKFFATNFSKVKSVSAYKVELLQNGSEVIFRGNKGISKEYVENIASRFLNKD